MVTDRRRFLQAATLGSLALGLAHAGTTVQDETAAQKPADKRLKLLFLGGTAFLGPACVEYALGRGHTVTVFNRGKTGADLFPEVERLKGDRHDDVKALEGDREWDVVIDTTAYVPAHVVQTAGMLAGRVKNYVVVSSISAYAELSKPIDESGKVAEITDEVAASMKTIKESLQHYGAMKARCEAAAEAAMPGRVLTVRPGLIVGPRDRTDRFTYWPVRIDRGGEVLAPGDGSDPVQFIDVRDLGEWIIRAVENGTTGLFNAISPAGRFTMAEMLYGIKGALVTDARFTWVDKDFLEARKIAPWSQLPVWVPPVGEYAGFHLVSVKKAVEAGLSFRPLAETVRDTIAWFGSLGEERRQKMGAGLGPDLERELLRAWHARKDAAPA